MTELTDDEKQEKLTALMRDWDATGIVTIIDGGPMRGMAIRMDRVLANTLPRFLRRLADTLEQDLAKKDN